ncbi:MAG: hypothetical protein OCD00_07020 [Colwellia sp.]
MELGEPVNLASLSEALEKNQMIPVALFISLR